MFTGIVRQISDIVSVRRRTGSLQLAVRLGKLADDVQNGDSVLIDGVCLTATSCSGTDITFDVSAETARLTTLGGFFAGRRVNVGLAMRPEDRFGGHFVSGHIDGAGEVLTVEEKPGEVRLRIGTDPGLTSLMIHKGSVAVNGISLTIALLEESRFEISLIPHTLQVTTLKNACAGDMVNIECDMIGKWVKKLMSAGNDSGREKKGGGLTMDSLMENLTP